MKKLYLLATLVWVAFTGNAGNVTTVGGHGKTLPVATQIHQGLKGLERPAAPVNSEKNREALLAKQSEAKLSEAQSGSVGRTFVAPRTSMTAPRTAAQGQGLVVDAHGIITSPAEGVTKIYARSGGNYYLDNTTGKVKTSTQDNLTYLEIVETADGTVYIKDMLSTVNLNTWVKGTKTEDKITVPVGQPLYYNETRGAAVRVQWGRYVEPYFTYFDDQPEVFTFVLSGETLSLQGTALAGDFVGAFWDNDHSFIGYGDYETVWTKLDVEKKSHDLVQLPDGVEAEPWLLNKQYYSGNDLVSDDCRVKVAIDGQDFYLKGLFRNYPNAWIMGTLVGSDVYFDTDQYLGEKDGVEGWAVGVGLDEQQQKISKGYSFSYDADKHTLRCTSDIAVNQSEFSWAIKETYAAMTLQKWTPVEFNVPFVDSLTHVENFLNYEVVDANLDGTSWNFNSNNNLTVCFYSPDLIASDDWLISPAVNLSAGQLYNFRLDAAARTKAYKEKFIVKWGLAPTPEAMTHTLIDTTGITNEVFDTFTSEEFEVPESGKYYFGIQCVSDPNMWRLAVRSIGMSLFTPGAVPAAIADAQLIADAEGALQAEVRFTAPAQDIKGEALTGDVHVIVQVAEVPVDTITVQAGQVASYFLTVAQPETYSVALVPYVVDEKNGAKTRLSAWIGEDVPAIDKASGLNIGSKVFLSWSVAAKGEHDAVINPAHVTYNVYTAEVYETTYGGIVYVADQLLTPTPISEAEFVIEDPDFAECAQGTVTYLVVAQNAAGTSEQVPAVALVGKPYTVPFLEDFDGESLSYYWSAYGSVSIDDDEGEGYADLHLSAGQVSYLSSGMICLKGEENPSLTLEVASYDGTELNVYIDAASGKLQHIATLETGEDFIKQRVSLKDYVNEEWVCIILAGLSETGDFILIDNIAISDLPDHDLSLTLTAPESVMVGKKATFDVTIESLGEITASDYAVRLYVDDELLKEVAPAEIKTLDYGQQASYQFDYEVSFFTLALEATIRAEVIYAADEDPNNNSDEVEMTFLTPEEDPVLSVAAATTDQGLSISWQPVGILPTECFEDFESYADQCVGGQGQFMGRWMGYDGDSLSSYVIDYDDQTIDWAFDDCYYAFCVWTPSLYTNDEETLASTAHGEKSLMFMGGISAKDVESSNDWLISPELTGDPQIIRFWVSMPYYYDAESYEVYYSTTDRELSSFQLLAEDEVESVAFSEREYALPEGAKYFAIRYVSEDVFGLIIDDISYRGFTAERPAGYHIFVDEQLVATVDADATSYDYVASLTEGNHKVSVSVLYPGGRESLATSTKVAVSAIETLAAETTEECVYTLTGLRLRADKPRKAGVYIVNGRKETTK